jgi:hypothetical protein
VTPALSGLDRPTSSDARGLVASLDGRGDTARFRLKEVVESTWAMRSVVVRIRGDEGKPKAPGLNH